MRVMKVIKKKLFSEFLSLVTGYEHFFDQKELMGLSVFEPKKMVEGKGFGVWKFGEHH